MIVSPAASREQAGTAGSPYFASSVEGSRATSRPELDRSLEVLRTNKDSWVALPMSERLALLDEVRRAFISLGERWVAAEVEAKRLPRGSLGEAEEWTILATIHRALHRLRRSLSEIEASGQPTVPGPVRTRDGGQVVVKTCPATTFDRLLLPGVVGEVWMEPGFSVDDMIAGQAAAYKEPQRPGKVCLVLGAGNASMLPVCDTVDKLFVELEVVVLKPNPVNAHLGPLLEEGFRALIDRGFLAIVYGGAEVGAYLSGHSSVDELHVTGSDKTFEAVVFGPGPEGQARKAERRPLITKRFTGELGNLSPVIIVPGSWQSNDIEEQAKQIATWLSANAGFACLTPRVLVQHRSWDRRDTLIGAIERRLERVPTRYAYYPGAHERHAEFLEAHPDAHQFGARGADRLPWTLIRDVDPEQTNDICFRREAFCGLFAETVLEAPDVPSFIDQAVTFANGTLWGTLCATIIVHPRSLRDPSVGAAVERAISDFRYGTVALNILPFYSNYLMGSPWGAFTGHDIYDVQSGIGKTFNMLMFDRAQKSVIRAPFKRLDPLTVASKRPVPFARRLAEFEADPSWTRVPALLHSALRA